MAAASDGTAIAAQIELTPIQVEFIQGMDGPPIAAGRDRKGPDRKGPDRKGPDSKGTCKQ